MALLQDIYCGGDSTAPAAASAPRALCDD
jgi:hypothetical protein